jgi:hypothetical protein
MIVQLGCALKHCDRCNRERELEGRGRIKMVTDGINRRPVCINLDLKRADPGVEFLVLAFHRLMTTGMQKRSAPKRNLHLNSAFS